ncbi:MAG: hypothetical protein AAF393_08125 [Pseudomonadota bacterium]
MIISAILAAWIGLSAAVMALTDAAPGAWVVMPSDALMQNLPDGAAVTDVDGVTVTLKSAPGLTADLYAAGAWLVLPAGLTGCLRPPEDFAKG